MSSEFSVPYLSGSFRALVLRTVGVWELISKFYLYSLTKSRLIQILSTTNNVKALFHWLSYGTEDIDSAEVTRWRRAEDIYDKQLSGISPSSSIINDVTKPIVKDQEEEDLSIWKGSVGFDATTSPGAAVLALNEDVGTRNVGQGQRGEDIGRNAEEEKDEARRLR